MKYKPHPHIESNGDYLEQGCLDGLNKAAKKWAKDTIKRYKNNGQPIPYGAIRATAKKVGHYKDLNNDTY